jgi:uroporphyrin-III C-methyltransferase/precorrin-2 dehydrogenase/sirohydrochlorin ferrochelatase
VSERLIALGLCAATPVAVIENASRDNRRMLTGTLADLSGLQTMPGLDGPTLIFIGRAAAFANLSQAEPIVTPALRKIAA